MATHWIEADTLQADIPSARCAAHDEKEQTLNQLLVELDGFDSSKGLVLLAATNRPEILDPALLRAGRFDRQVLVDRPDKKGRVEILKVHLRNVKLATDVDPEKVAALTPGFTGADLANLVNEAALLATRRGADAVSMLKAFAEALRAPALRLEDRDLDRESLFDLDARLAVAFRAITSSCCCPCVQRTSNGPVAARGNA